MDSQVEAFITAVEIRLGLKVGPLLYLFSSQYQWRSTSCGCDLGFDAGNQPTGLLQTSGGPLKPMEKPDNYEESPIVHIPQQM